MEKISTSNKIAICNLWSLNKICKCLFIPNCARRSKARALSEKITYLKLCVRSKQTPTIKTIIYNDIFTSLRRKKVQIPAKIVQGIVQPGLLLLCTELTLFCMKLPENCVYLNQSELSNFFIYLINHLIRYMKKITQRSPIAMTKSSNNFIWNISVRLPFRYILC